MPADFDIRSVERQIRNTRFAGSLQHLRSAGSTNQHALEAADRGARVGVWIADEQTAGRGRGGHDWHSVASDGLYISALASPQINLSDASKIPLATGLAAQAALAEVTGLRPDLRWPNDLMLGGRKCGGVLVESASEPASRDALDAMLRYVVIGVGINLNHVFFPEGLKQTATSLSIETGRSFDREPLLAAFLERLEQELSSLEASAQGAEQMPNLLQRFTEASSWVLGKRVRVGEDEGYTGCTAGLDEQGFLLVRDEHGVRRTVLSGGVRER